MCQRGASWDVGVRTSPALGPLTKTTTRVSRLSCFGTTNTVERPEWSVEPLTCTHPEAVIGEETVRRVFHILNKKKSKNQYK